MTMRRHAESTGFTLMEVMVASAILSFEILAVLAIFGVSAKSNAFARRLTGAGSLAQAQIEKGKNTAYVNLANATECFDKDLQGPIACDGKEVFTRTTTITANSPVNGMSQIAVLVSWKDAAGKTHGTTLISSISRY